jgi:thiol-disulfide isomerase/thioredoxin/Leucine-rich repeat (LRR) protein
MRFLFRTWRHKVERTAIIVIACLWWMSPGIVGEATAAEAAAEAVKRPARTLSFPSEEALGTIYIDEGTAADGAPYDVRWKRLGPALGDVVVPAGVEVRLDLSAGIANPAEGLAALPSDALRMVLDMSGSADEELLRQLGRQRRLKELFIMGKGVDDRAIVHLSGLSELEVVQAGDTRIADEGAACLAMLPALKSLSLHRTSISDQGLQSLGAAPRLEMLSVSGTAISDQGLAGLKGLVSLKWLSIANTPITDVGLKHLADLIELEHIQLSDTLITDGGLKHLAGMNKLKYLRFDQNNISDAGLVHLEKLPALETLMIAGKFDGAGLASIARIQSLRGLHFTSGIPIAPESLAHLAQLPQLEELNISGSALTDHSVKHLASIESLQSVWIQHAPITDAGLAEIAMLPRLSRLVLSSKGITWAGLNSLAKCSSLSRLDISQIGSDPTTLEPLAMLKGLTWLSLPEADFAASDYSHLSGLKRLKQLEIGGRIDDEGVRQLRELHDLAHLHIGNADLSNEGLRHLVGLANLRELTVGGRFTDDGLSYLATMKSLRQLDIDSAGVSERGLDALSDSLPELVQLLSSSRPYFLGRKPKVSMQGQRAPDFTVVTLDGGAFKLSEQRGKVVLLYLWATWCGPCVRETPARKEFEKEMAAKYDRFEMLSLSVDDDELSVRQHVAKFGLPWKQAWIGTHSDIPWDYHAHGAGYYIVVGPDGIIRRVDGTFDELRAAIADCLEDGGL